ncbi:Mechanosensitive ion channel precursor [gamma proteobacterium HdN1]|nr:Mechanosensitive ion channel precursor [gamma proteobacterium HdN1]
MFGCWPRRWSVLRVLVLAAWCLLGLGAANLAFTPIVHAAIPGLVPAPKPEENPADVEARQRATLDAQIADSRKALARVQNDTEQLIQLAATAPARAEAIRKDIEKVSQTLGRENVDRLGLDAVRQRLQLIEAELQATDLALSEVYQKISEQQSIPSLTRERIAGVLGEIDSAEKRVQNLQGSSEGIPALKLQLAQAELERLFAQRRFHEAQLESYQKLLEYQTAHRDLLSAQLAVARDTYGKLQQRLEKLSKDEAERKQAAFAEIEHALIGMPQPVLDIAVRNKKDNDELIRLQQALRDANAQDKEYADVAQEIRQRYQVAVQQLDVGGYNRYYMEHVRYMARVVRPLLNRGVEGKDSSVALVEARARQFTIDDQQREVRNRLERERKIERLLAKLSESERATPGLVDEVHKLYIQRGALLEQLSQVNGNYVVAMTNFELSRKRLQSEEAKFMAMLSQKMVWLHSSPPMSWDIGLVALKGAYSFFVQSPWAEIARLMDRFLADHFWQELLLFVVFAGVFYFRHRLLQVLDHVGPRIGRVGQDRFRYTVRALGVTLIAALPVPLIMQVFGGVLVVNSPYQSFPFGVGELMLRMSPIALMVAMVPVMMRNNGLGRLHFRWSRELLSTLKQQLPWIILQLCLFALGAYLMGSASEQRSVFTFARMVMLVANGVLAYNLWSMLRPGKGLIAKRDVMGFFDVHWRARYLWMPTLIGLPVLCCLLVIVGYDFAVLFFARMFYVTLLAGFSIYLAHQVVTRWFAVQERQIALERARARRAADRAARSREEADPAAEVILEREVIDEINLEAISEHNRTLLKVVAYAVFVAVLLQMWSDVAPVLDGLDKYVLWKVSGKGVDGQVEELPITLWRLLTVLFLLVVTIFSGRNLPGVVEVVLLQRFRMEKSVRFAMTTVARYVIFVVGITTAFKMLGIAWDKIGWLMAAVGVGLGFGLQEIFANFVSGIIIILERPIRIGDVVTIADQSGVVTEIRMRATTVVDFDQKELIIPNKTIVTNQLINWTLSDSVTRIMISVSVRHGSDVEKVVQTLMEIATSHPNVMKSPSPAAYFMSLGDKLNFELRIYVPEVSMRRTTLHDVNMAIERSFREQGIRIEPAILDVRLGGVQGGGF